MILQNELRYRLTAEDKATAEIRNLAESFRGLERTMKQASSGIVSMVNNSRGLDKMHDPIARANAETRRLADSANDLDKMSQPVSRLTGLFGSMHGAIVGAGAAFIAFGAGAFIRNMADVAIESERFDRVLRTVTGSQAGAAREMRFLQGLSGDLGLEFRSLARDYAGVAAAANGTKLQGAETQKIFKSVASASAALGLSADDTSGVLRALNQMISKGKVQAEELRGQLGERLPGAFQMAARAMGLTTAELDKFMAQGLITADALLPALARELENTYGRASRENAESLGGSINKLSNEFFQLTKTIADGGLSQVMQGLVSYTADMVKLLTDGIKEIKGLTTAITEEFMMAMEGEAVNRGAMIRTEDQLKPLLDSKAEELKKAEERLKNIQNQPKVSRIGNRSDLAFTSQTELADSAQNRVNKLRSELLELRGEMVLAKRKSIPIVPKTATPDVKAPQTVKAQDLEKPANLTAEQERIRSQILAEANKAKLKTEETRNKQRAESIRNQFRSEVEKIQEERRLLEELYSKKDSTGSKFLTEKEYSRAQAYLAEKEALASVDKEMVKMQAEVDQINDSFRTQSERLSDVRARLTGLYSSGAITDAEEYAETLKRIDEEIAKAKKAEEEKGKPNAMEELAVGFKDAWKDSIKSVGDEFKKMVKDGELSLSRLKNAMLDTLTSKIIDKTIDIGINALLGGFGISGYATGGFPDPNKPYFAGERGRELIWPAGQAHRVFNAQDTKAIMEKNAQSDRTAQVINNITIQGNADDSAILRMLNEIEERTVARLIDLRRRGMA